KWTWISPDGQMKNVIDFVLYESKMEIKSFAADIRSDHKLITIRLRLKVTEKVLKTKIYDMDKLKEPDTRKEYKETMRKNISSLVKEEMNAEETWNSIKNGIMRATEQVLGYKAKMKKLRWMTDEVLQLSNKRRKLKENKKEDASLRAEYNRLTREIKQKAKRDGNNWISEQCKEAEEYVKRNATQGLYRKIRELSGTLEFKMSAVKDKSRQIIEDEQGWKEYFEELYNVQNPADEKLPSTNEGEQMPKFLEEVVKISIESLKKKKAPGSDNITAELLQAGEEHTVKAMHKLFNKIYKQEQVPSEWGKAIIVPICKKGDKSECKNYKGISLLSALRKAFTKTLQRRMKRFVDVALAEDQAGFRPEQSTIDQLFVIRQISEKYIEHNRTCYNNFIDFKQVFDSIWQKGIWQVLRMYGIPEKLIKSMSAVRINKKLTEWFRTIIGVAMTLALRDETAVVVLYGRTVNNLRFADDMDLIALFKEDLQKVTDKADRESRKFRLKISTEKTKIMAIGRQEEEVKIKVRDEELEQVEKFVYLGGLVSKNGNCEDDIKRRIGLAATAFRKLHKIWKAKDILIKTKIRVYETTVMPILLYRSECWIMRKADEWKILTAEMSWLRGNTESFKTAENNKMKRLGQEIALPQKIQERRLQWFGRVSRMDPERIPHMAIHTKVQGVKTRGRTRM
uniref:Reverse transcriptase domain-containing protein n=1 Tax=Latimeria chalumnae TaxID=7897 RepID=H3B0L2_LATCH